MIAEKIYKVFVSSTYEDLREERAAVQRGLLQLGCLPVGMELFPAADEETFEFIKSQIDDSDYYVLVVGGRYGSQGAAGVSFTEMEYDYAIGKKKPAIGFVHADPGAIAANKTESSEEGRAKLSKFLAKVRTRPVRQFRNPHELALEVTTSFVQLIRDKPAIGYVRTDESVDFKRYSVLLEENSKLKEALSASQTASIFVPFAAHLKVIALTILRSSNQGKVPVGTVDCTLGQAFQAVAEAALQYDNEGEILGFAAKEILGNSELDKSILSFDESSRLILRRYLLLYGLIEIALEDRSTYSTLSGTLTRSFTVWRLTDYGRRQLAAVAP